MRRSPQFARDADGRVWARVLQGAPVPASVRWVCVTDPRLEPVCEDQPDFDALGWKPARPKDQPRCIRVAGAFYGAEARKMLRALADGYSHLTLSSTAHLAGMPAATFRRRMRTLLWAIRPDQRRWYYDWAAERWAIFEALELVDTIKAERRARRNP